MRSVDRKTEIAPLDGTPDKKLFWSIMNDYDFKTAITELVDNCFDIWIREGRLNDLAIYVDVDIDRQLVRIKDNAAGVNHAELHNLITPGGSANDPYSETIGVFGVGSKRAAIAIAEYITIQTRYREERSYQIDISPEWLESPTWELAAYQVPDLAASSTFIEFSHLRRTVSQSDVDELRVHLAETYGLLLNKGRSCIFLQGLSIDAITFDHWSYPPEYPPQETLFSVQPEEGRDVLVEVKAGLISDRDPVKENYGVYVYCNDRLVVKELRTRDVGYNITAEAGRPHPDASLCRVIVHFAGPARLMPWNSSKSNIVPGHPTFRLAAPTIVHLCAYFSRLSRALKNQWDTDVYPYQEGTAVEIPPEEATFPQHIILPPIPRQRSTQVEKLKEQNERQIGLAPYLVGLLEAVAMVDVISRQRLETGNRLALILLDTTFEIAIKEYLVHKRDMFSRQKVDNILGNRTDSIDYLRSKIVLDDDIFRLAEHYYEQRNKLVHERATLQVSDRDIEIYRSVVQRLLTSLYYAIW